MDVPFTSSAVPQETPQAGAAVARLSAVLHAILTAAFLVFAFIGTSPLSTNSLTDRVDGNPLNRALLLSMAALAVMVLLLNYRALPSLLWRAAGTWALVAFATLSFLWSDFPDLTLRRTIVLACMTLTAAGVAVGIHDLRRATKIFCLFAAGVILINLASIVLVPARAITEIGVQGIYAQKNEAGTVAMIAALANAAWLFGWKHRPTEALGATAMLGLSMAFLVLSQSKTSLGLALLGIVMFVGYILVARGGPIVLLAALLAGLAACIGLVIVLTLNEFDIMAVIGLVLADTSLTGRDELWAFATRVAMERPWLGHGYAAFWDVGPGADPLLRADPGSWLGDIEAGIINQAHNGYLELWLQLGLPATILATLVFFALFARSLLHSFISNVECRPAFALFAVMALIFILHNITEASLFIRGILLFSVMQPLIFLVARADTLRATPAETA